MIGIEFLKTGSNARMACEDPHDALGGQTPSAFTRPVDEQAYLQALLGSQLGWY